MMCCADLRGELSLGSLDEYGFLELWNGAQATGARLKHLDGCFEGVCAGCGGINWYDTTPAMAEQARLRGQELGLSS